MSLLVNFLEYSLIRFVMYLKDKDSCFCFSSVDFKLLF